MTKLNDGGAAFPNSVQPDFQYAEAGMTLRDRFAGQAIIGILSGPMNLTEANKKRVVADAYDIADAMLAARSLQAQEKDDA